MAQRPCGLHLTAVLVLLLALGGMARAAAPSAETQAEIAHLLSYLEQSSCAFNRNGTWYSAAEARAHLERKEDYLLRRSLIGRTEDFIARAATESSLTHQPYLVRCGSAAAVPCGRWLTTELERYRTTRRPPGQATGVR